jgi:hypothetical protein
MIFLNTIMYPAIIWLLCFCCVALLQVLLNTELIVQVSDTTGDAISTNAGYQKYSALIKRWETDTGRSFFAFISSDFFQAEQ